MFLRNSLIALVLLVLAATLAAQPRSEQTIRYASGALSIVAQVFYPQQSEPAPVVLFNHGGVSGISAATAARCRRLRDAGFLVFASAYRGEDGSDGEIEVAQGEVDDVLAALAWLRDEPRANMSRVGLVGTSHGALISLKAAGRDQSFKALVFAYGVADIYTWYAHLQRSGQLGNDPLTRRIYGDGPAHLPEAFVRRHGLAAVPTLSPTLPVLIVQGGLDKIVPPDQAQTLHDALAARGQPVELALYPDSGHGMLINPPRQGAAGVEGRAAWQRVVAFLVESL